MKKNYQLKYMGNTTRFIILIQIYIYEEKKITNQNDIYIQNFFTRDKYLRSEIGR